MKSTLRWSLPILAVAALLACGPGGGGKGPVTVATMVDSEGALLGKSMVLLLQARGFQVVDKTSFGTPDVLRKALEAKEVDLVVDYTGSGQYYHEGQDPAVFTDAVRGYETTRKLDQEKHDLVWLKPAPANNTEALAMLRPFAAANGVVALAEPLAARGQTVWLDHGWGVYSGYFHMSDLAVALVDAATVVFASPAFLGGAHPLVVSAYVNAKNGEKELAKAFAGEKQP